MPWLSKITLSLCLFLNFVSKRTLNYKVKVKCVSKFRSSKQQFKSWVTTGVSTLNHNNCTSFGCNKRCEYGTLILRYRSWCLLSLEVGLIDLSTSPLTLVYDSKKQRGTGVLFVVRSILANLKLGGVYSLLRDWIHSSIMFNCKKKPVELKVASWWDTSTNQ